MNQKEKISYLKALMFIAVSDDKVDESERQQFTNLGVIYGLNRSEINEIADSVIKKEDSLEEILENISDRSTKLLLIYDLLAICYADNNYSLAEQNSMKSIARIMGIEEKKLSELEAIMQESVALQEKINKILEK